MYVIITGRGKLNGDSVTDKDRRHADRGDKVRDRDPPRQVTDPGERKPKKVRKLMMKFLPDPKTWESNAENEMNMDCFLENSSVICNVVRRLCF